MNKWEIVANSFKIVVSIIVMATFYRQCSFEKYQKEINAKNLNIIKKNHEDNKKIRSQNTENEK